MPSVTLNGSDYINRVDPQFQQDFPLAGYITVGDLSAESWSSRTFDPTLSYNINFRSADGSKISAAQSVSNFTSSTGAQESRQKLAINIVSSQNDRLNLLQTTETTNRTALDGLSYNNKTINNVGVNWKYLGESSIALDDLSLASSTLQKVTTTGTRSSANTNTGDSTRIIVTDFSINASSADFSLTAVFRGQNEERQQSYQFSESGTNTFERDTLNISTYNFLDKADGFSLSMGKGTYIYQKSNGTETGSISLSSVKAVTQDYLMTTALFSKTLTAAEIAIFEGDETEILPAGDVNLIKSSYFQSVEPIILSGSNNVTIRNTEGVIFDAGAGNDRITGNIGNDSLSGGTGNDTIAGGVGTDVLTGGTGADLFRFSNPNEMGLLAESDVITDFKTSQTASSAAERDRISFSGFDAILSTPKDDRFAFSSPPQQAESTGWAGKIWISTSNFSGVTLVNLSTDEDSAPEHQIALVGVDPTKVSGADFVF